MAVAKPCFVGARGIDSLPFSQGGSAAQAQHLKASGIDFVALYLGVASKALADACLAAGLMVYGVSLADDFDGHAAVARMQALGMPAGTSAFLDVEGHRAYVMDPAALIAAINAWADALAAAGYVPGVYIGSPQPLTTDELTKLHVVRYWRAPARVVDRFNHLAEPTPGWCAEQDWPSVFWPNDHDPLRVWCDVDHVTQDFKGRTPPMAAA